MKKVLPISAIILLLLLLGSIFYLLYDRGRQEDRIKLLEVRNQVDSLYWANKALKASIVTQEEKKQEIKKEQDAIVHHYYHYLNSIKTSPDSVQYTLRDTLIAKYRTMDKTPYMDSNLNRETNYRLAQGLEAKELVIVQEKVIAADSTIINDQKAIIANDEKTIADMALLEKESKENLAKSEAEKNKETKRKKRWRKVAIYEGIGLGGLLALILL